jgi:hypothetical protein
MIEGYLQDSSCQDRYICHGSAYNMLDRMLRCRLNAPNVSEGMVVPWLSATSDALKTTILQMQVSQVTVV